MILDFKKYKIPFHVPFEITHGSRTHLETIIVALHHNSWVGYGEIPIIPYYGLKVDDVQKELEGLRSWLKGMEPMHPATFFDHLTTVRNIKTFVLAGLDVAMHDLYAKIQQMAVWELLALPKPKPARTSFTLFSGSITQLEQQVRQHPWPIFKVKLNEHTAIPAITFLLENTKAELRLDANTGWNRAFILKNIGLLQHERIQCIEQPLPISEDAAMLALSKETNLPFMADERFQRMDDLAFCAKAFKSINIKLSKCGGITPALALIREARKNGMQIMLGCMAETSVAVSPLYHLSGLVDMLDMDAPLLLQHDLATGLNYDRGWVQLNEGSGLGIQLL